MLYIKNLTLEIKFKKLNLLKLIKFIDFDYSSHKL